MKEGMPGSLARALVGEALGSALLAALVIGSGIMAERLAGGNAGVALLGNTLATGAGLPVLILIFGPVSGAHLNPAVTLYLAGSRAIGRRTVLTYVPVQIVGAIAGTLLAHVMFGRPLLELSTHMRSGLGQWIGEFVATWLLLATIVAAQRRSPVALPYLVGLVISAGYWFTSSTSFANPAIAVARAFTDSFAGIRLADVPGFVLAEIVAAAVALPTLNWLFRDEATA